MEEKKKKVFGAVLATAALALAVSCTTVAPGEANAGVSANAKRGEATGGFLFGLIPVTSADVSISTAAANGGVKNIATVDHKAVSYLGIWVVRTTIVTGE